MGYFKSMDSLSTGSESRSMPTFTSVEYSVKTFLEKLKYSAISDKEIQDIIYRQYTEFLDYDLFLANPESKHDAQELFTNERFLSNIIVCVTNLTLNDYQIICCNKMAYDYIEYHSVSDCNQEVRTLLLELSFRVDLKWVLPLSAIVGIEPAKYIAMLRRSSFKEEQNILRLNKYLIRSGLEIKEQQIMDIYGKLFESVSNLFAVTMFSLPEDDYSKLEQYRYDEMTKCMIDILDSMPSVEIRKVLENYSTMYFMRGEPRVRFSMRGLHESYNRINTVVYGLIDDGVLVP